MTALSKGTPLRPHLGRLVEISTTEGELLRAVLDWIWEDREEIMYDFPVATNQPERYLGEPDGAGFVIPWEFIRDLAEVPAEEAIRQVLGAPRAPLTVRYGPRRGEQIGWVSEDGAIQGRFAADGGVVFRTGGK